MKLTLPVLVLAAALPAGAAARTLAERIVLTDTLFESVQARPLASPAMLPLRQPVSLSHVSAGFARASMDAAVDYAVGKGSGRGFFDAATYMRLGRATVAGHASYRNGRRFGSRFCEVSDPQLVYPYYTADALGGDFRGEQYTFGGSYASAFGRGWICGVRLDYRALLEYRHVDPRPRNVVGQLSASAALGRRIGGYSLALGADVFRYTQSNSIMFVSELGEIPVYHLTGLGHHYARFAGTGKSANFSGWNRGVSLALMPDRRGLSASLSFGRFTFDKVLRDIDNLPLNTLRRDTWEASAGWRDSLLSVSAWFSEVSRRGCENIFGEPQGNIYPELFSLTTYTARVTEFGVRACRRFFIRGGRADIFAAASHMTARESYLGEVPPASARTRRSRVALAAQWVAPLASRCVAHAGPSAEQVFGFYTRVGASAAFDWMLGGNKSVGMALGGAWRRASGANCGYDVTAAVTFKF